MCQNNSFGKVFLRNNFARDGRYQRKTRGQQQDIKRTSRRMHVMYELFSAPTWQRYQSTFPTLVGEYSNDPWPWYMKQRLTYTLGGVFQKPNGPAEVQCEYFTSRCLGWILEGELWEVNFLMVNFSGGFFCWKKAGSEKTIRPKNSGPKFGRPKFVSQNSGFGGAESPVQKSVPDISYNHGSVCVCVCVSFKLTVHVDFPRDAKPQKGILFLKSQVWLEVDFSPQYREQKSTPNMTGRRFHRTMEMIPAHPW